jgi:hypothetical protein
MEIIIIVAVILQSIAVSLGVGSSTLAIINFFVAIADGKIDEGERSMMGIVYIVLRVAMVMILLTTGILSALQYALLSTVFLSPFVIGFWFVLAMLYVNATLMTMRIMPSTIGPALQASSWYTLGILMTLSSMGLTAFTFIEFSLAYVAAVLLAVFVVHVAMVLQKRGKVVK